ncbi:hypothetical protein M2157_000500 [Streptomyces sp. SAI-127]|nr:hypothetical protein [Streptomyces sp. SAI-127]
MVSKPASRLSAIAWTRVGVGGHGESEPVCLVGDQSQVRSVVLLIKGVGAGCHGPAAGHHLHHVAAALGAFAYRGPQRVGPLGLAAEEPAVAAAGGDRRARDNDVGALRGRHLLTQREGEVVAVAEVPDGSDTRRQRGRRGSACGLQHGLGGVGRHMRDGVVGGVPTKMHVRVDQPGKQPRLRPEVRHRRVLRRCRSREIHVTDHAVLDQHHAGRPDVHAVEDVPCFKRQQLAAHNRHLQETVKSGGWGTSSVVAGRAAGGCAVPVDGTTDGSSYASGVLASPTLALTRSFGNERSPMAGIDGINTGAQAWFREPRPGPAQAMLALPKAHGVMSKSPAHSRSCHALPEYRPAA